MMDEDLRICDVCLCLVKNEGNVDIITLHRHGKYFAVNNGTEITHKSKYEIVHKFTALACKIQFIPPKIATKSVSTGSDFFRF